MLELASLAAFVPSSKGVVVAAARSFSSLALLSPKFGCVRGGASTHEKGGAEHMSRP